MYTNRLRLSSLTAGTCVAFLLLLFPSLVIGDQDTILILIDTKTLTLKVMEGKQEKLTFSNIAIGRYGTDTNKRRGDKKTPLGRFTIGWITEDTSFHRFFGFRYPTREYAKRSFQAGQIDKKTWDRIRQAYESGRLPPQDTVLGGRLGIHGIGDGDIKIHEKYNWTNGCVALTNDQIDLLADWVKVGTPVEIR